MFLQRTAVSDNYYGSSIRINAVDIDAGDTSKIHTKIADKKMQIWLTKRFSFMRILHTQENVEQCRMHHKQRWLECQVHRGEEIVFVQWFGVVDKRIISIE